MQAFKYTISFSDLRQQILALTKSYSHFSVLDSCAHIDFKDNDVNYKLIAGFGAHKFLSCTNSGLTALDTFLKEESNGKYWKFGFLGYDLKNEIEQINSSNSDTINFPLLHFFIPEIVIVIKEEVIEIECYATTISAESIFQQLMSDDLTDSDIAPSNIEFEFPSASDYCKIIDQIKYHLQRGDIYEINYCIQLLQHCHLDPLSVYKKLTEYAPSPFSCFARIDDYYLMCASPERFIAKEEARIFSQPMKGTSKRSDNYLEDENLKRQLAQNEKERAENVMIVDLVRNDLSRIAKKGSVKVDELFGVYTFPRVHQMVSTVSAELQNEISFVEIIRAMFPMGSMTGAPKVRAMQLIEELENFKRGIFSGSVGYIKPDNDFDFNVVIRSIIYNAKTNQLSIPVGSAITAKCDAMLEYEECILKAQGMLNALRVSESLTNTNHEDR